MNLTRICHSVHQFFPWTLLAQFGVPDKMIAVIRQFHDEMRACARLDDGVCLDWFTVSKASDENAY